MGPETIVTLIGVFLAVGAVALYLIIIGVIGIIGVEKFHL